MTDSYWRKVLQGRISRRRVLATGATTSAAAVLLAACGGDGDGGGEEQQGTGVVAPVQDETKSLARGGIYKSVLGTPTTLDPHLTGPQTTHCWMCYSQLLRTKPGHMENTNGEIDPELLESWEVSPDKLTITGRLRTDTGFSPVPPVNGRNVTMDDVLFSWARYKQISPRRGDLANDINKDAPISSLTASDNRTLIIKLAQPYAPILSALSAKFNGTYYIVPKEAENTAALDLKGSVAGTGPFYMSEWIPTTSTFFRRNAGFKMDSRDVPYIEGADFFALPDYPTQVAQFRAGAIHDQYGNFQQEDILPLKQDLPQLEILAAGNDSTALTGAQIRAFFGQNPDSPFRDQRVRQAFVLTWDRDLFIDVSFNVQKFEDAGLPMRKILVNGLRDESWPGWHLDPSAKDFGENGKFFRPDIAEAKKLLTAAGHTGALEHDVFTTVYGGAFNRQMETLTGMAESSQLFKPKIQVLDFGSVWNVTFRNNKGAFSGAGFILDINELDPAIDMHQHYHPSGSKYFGGDDTLNGLLDRMITEYDTEARKKLAHDVQRYEGGANFQPLPGGASTFRITWPALRNKFVWQGDSQGRYLATVWLDRTKAPFV